MVMPHIIAIEEELSSSIVVSDNLDRLRVTKLLDILVSNINRPQSIEELSFLLSMFRKWKVIYHEYFRDVYTKNVSYELSNFDELTYFPTIHVEESYSQIKVPQQKGDSSFYKNLIKCTDPYKSFYDDFQSNIYDAELLTEAEKIIVSAIDLFKKSKFMQAMEHYRAVTEMLNGSGAVSNKIKYYFSWALHGVGNIYYVCNQYSTAIKYYSASLLIKNSIPHLPKISIYQTASKECFCRINIWGFQEVENDIKELRRNLNRDRNDLCKWNESLLKNLEDDIYYNISIGALYSKNKSKCFLFLNKSYKIAEEIGDITGQIRCLIIKGSLVKNHTKYIDALKLIFENLNQEKKKDPYIKRMANDDFLAELQYENYRYSIQIQELLDNYHITPISTCSYENTKVS
jgi:hypothetical protein